MSNKKSSIETVKAFLKTLDIQVVENSYHYQSKDGEAQPLAIALYTDNKGNKVVGFEKNPPEDTPHKWDYKKAHELVTNMLGYALTGNGQLNRWEVNIPDMTANMEYEEAFYNNKTLMTTLENMAKNDGLQASLDGTWRWKKGKAGKYYTPTLKLTSRGKSTASKEERAQEVAASQFC